MRSRISQQEYLRRFKVSQELMNASNCVGTALFLLGIKHSDSHIDPTRAPRIFENSFVFLEQTIAQALLLRLTNNSEVLTQVDLLSLNGSHNVQGHFPQPLHCMIVSPLDNSQILHRRGYHGSLEELPISEALQKYSPLLHVFLYALR